MNAARTRVELMARALIWEIHMNVIVQVATPAINAVTIDFGYKNFLWLSLGRNQYRREGL